MSCPEQSRLSGKRAQAKKTSEKELFSLLFINKKKNKKKKLETRRGQTRSAEVMGEVLECSDIMFFSPDSFTQQLQLKG